MTLNMTNSRAHSDDRIRPNRFAATGLLIWMLGVMLFGWFVLDGPGVSSVVKRVGPLKHAQRVVRRGLGEPPDPAAASDGNPQP